MVVWLGLRVRIQICIYHLTLILPCHHIMSSLQPPAKEELAQELLAFKHIEHYPASFEELPYRVRQITDNCLHQRQLYDNTVERRRLTRKYMNDLQELEAQLSMKPQKYTYCKMAQLHSYMDEASRLLYGEAPKQRSEFLQNLEDLGNQMMIQIRTNVMAFRSLKENVEAAGRTYNYSAISQQEMRIIAQSKFETAREAVKYVGKGLNSKDWWN